MVETIEVAHELIKYISMFVLLAVIVLLINKTKLKTKVRWYHTMALGFIVGFSWTYVFRFMTGW